MGLQRVSLRRSPRYLPPRAGPGSYPRAVDFAPYRSGADRFPPRSTPHGGYLLAVILRALIAYQADQPASPRQPSSPPALVDPLSLQAQFLTSVAPGPVEIHISTVRAGRSIANLRAELLHRTGGDRPGECAITAEAVFTLFGPLPPVDGAGHHLPPSDGNMNLLPLSDSPYAIRSPLETHPSRLKLGMFKWEKPGSRWSRETPLGMVPGAMDWVEDPVIAERREKGGADGRQKTVEWGVWAALKHPEDIVDTAALAMFADVCGSQPELLPLDQRTSATYFPTLTMSVHFHAAFPPPAPYLADHHTVGIYCPGGSQIVAGRHEQRAEVWTAPSAVGEGQEQDGWRERSLCLLSATQTALTATGRNGGRL